ncbi:hypothetical protein GW17_00005514 [Ensete ventricosum]|nr:hypothetical protein GW17_00005514 [Ensete ventricosum]
MIEAIKSQPDDGPRSSLSIRLRFRRCSGILSKFAMRFAEGIRKLVGNMPIDRRKKTERLIARMLEAVELGGNRRSVRGGHRDSMHERVKEEKYRAGGGRQRRLL